MIDGKLLEEVTELIWSIHKRCDIYLKVVDVTNIHLLPTLLEDIHVDSQKIMDLFCIDTSKIAHESYPELKEG